jgi:hypothetical protein
MGFKKYSFNPIKELNLDIPKDKRQQALEEAAAFLKEQSLDYIAQGKSPVTGRKWAGLSKEYKTKKSEESGVDFANLELHGDLLDSFSVEASGNKITLDVGDDQQGKAEGHITGIYGNSSKVKPRKFMPQPGEKFTGKIIEELKSLLKEYED